jgi:hypothetical protein
MADIDELMNKRSDNYLFHGVKGATLAQLIDQSEDGNLVLWGRVEDEDENADYSQGQGELSATDINDIEMSFNEFCDQSGLVLVLEKQVAEPVDELHPTDRREHLIRCEEWRVVGGVRPVYDEDGEVVDQEAFSLEEIGEM